jgi:ectoine hydroxylase-related dioxygenase (phytanoyl-CoA dioxygenase family)
VSQASEYRESGFLHARGVFSTAEVEEMRAAVDAIVERAAAAEREQNHTWGGTWLGEEERQVLVLRGYHDLQYHDACFTRAACNARLAAILAELIGPNVQLHHSKMLVKPPERGAPFPMHQDHPYFPHARHTMLAASVHLDDADEENGCLHVVPGSHLLGPLAASDDGSHHLDPAEYPLDAGVPVPASAGDVVLFNYLTIHGSGVNRSDRPRRNVLFQYRDPEDLPVGTEHVNWGQGLMVCGHNPGFHATRPRFRIEEPATA